MINLNLNNFSTYVEKINSGVVSPILVKISKTINGETKEVDNLIVISEKGLNFISPSFLSFGYESEKSISMLPISNKPNLTSLVGEYFTGIQFKPCMRKDKEGAWSSSLYPFYTLATKPTTLKGAKLFEFLKTFSVDYGIDFEKLEEHVKGERVLREFFEIKE